MSTAKPITPATTAASRRVCAELASETAYRDYLREQATRLHSRVAASIGTPRALPAANASAAVWRDFLIAVSGDIVAFKLYGPTDDVAQASATATPQAPKAETAEPETLESVREQMAKETDPAVKSALARKARELRGHGNLFAS